MNIFESAQWLENHFQTILILDKVNVLLIELKANLYRLIASSWIIEIESSFWLIKT